MSGLVAAAVAPHTPRIGIEANAPDFARGLIDGERALGERLKALAPDLIVLQSSHWVCTFNWYITAQARHEGVCLADEAPDLIPGIPYARTGDPAFARALQGALQAADIPCGLNETPHFTWDYGSLVPLQYIDPEGGIPVVLLPVVICSDLAENMAVGRLVHETARHLGRRAVLIASCALSHQVRRGPELWPPQEMQDMDHRFVRLLCDGDVAAVAEWLPDYSRAAVAEMGGRPLAGLVGGLQALSADGGALTGEQFGPYGQSSGSGNATIGLWPAAA